MCSFLAVGVCSSGGRGGVHPTASLLSSPPQGLCSSGTVRTHLHECPRGHWNCRKTFRRNALFQSAAVQTFFVAL